MNNTAFLIYSHTDYNELWFASLSQCTEQLCNQSNIYIGINDISIYNNTLQHIFPDVNVVIYDDTLPWFNKLLNIVIQVGIKYKHVLLFIDCHMLNKIDNEKLSTIINIMNETNMDCFQLWCHDVNIGDNLVKNGINIAPHRNYYAFSGYPCIWKVTSLIDLLSKFPNTSYREIEDSYIQNYVVNNFSVYRFGLLEQVIRTSCGNMTTIFNFIRTMCHRHWCKSYKIYDDKFQIDYNNIIDRYNLKDTVTYKNADEAIKHCTVNPNCIMYSI